MKKIYYYLIPLIAALITACGDSQQGKEFTLTGKFVDNTQNGNPVYLQSFDNETGKFLSLDTVEVVDGAFTLTAKADSAAILYIAGKGLTRPHMFVAEAGAIEMSFDPQLQPTVAGTPLNDIYQEFADKRNSSQNKIKQITARAQQASSEGKLTPEYENEMENKYDSLYSEMKDYTLNFVKANIANPVGQFVFLDGGRNFELAQLEEIMPLVSENIKSTSKFKRIEKQYNALKATVAGQKFTDLKAPAPDGKEIALSDYAGKGKYVLIDFWASWCPPCRKDAPEVVKIYNQYKGKGFEIVGVSLDSKKENWEKGIKDLGLTWPQMSDLKYWDTELGASYGVNSIPHMVLLDKDGTILVKGITVQELSAKLAELLK